MHLIEMSINIWKIEKWLPHDRFRLVKNKEPSISVIQLTTDLNELGRDLNEHDLNERELYFSDSQEEHAPREPTVPWYHLRPIQNQPNYRVSLRACSFKGA